MFVYLCILVEKDFEWIGKVVENMEIVRWGVVCVEGFVNVCFQ